MFLKSIHLNNVKCFSDIALSLEDENGGIRKWTLLLAENGMGKSTLLKTIALVTGGSDAITDLLREPSDWIRSKTQRCGISANGVELGSIHLIFCGRMCYYDIEDACSVQVPICVR